MGETRKDHAFSLLELLAVSVIAVITLGTAIIHIQGLSEHARAKSVATQLGSIWFSATHHASDTGLPYVMMINRQGFHLEKPTRNDETWSWVQTPLSEFSRGVTVRSIKADGRRMEKNSASDCWQLTLTPGGMDPEYEMEFQCGNDHRVRLILNGCTGRFAIALMEQDN